MNDKLKSIKSAIERFNDTSNKGIEKFRITYISKKSVINNLFEDFKKLPIEEKKLYGNTLNQLKISAKDKLTQLSKKSKEDAFSIKDNIDYSLPHQEDSVGASLP